VQPLPIPADTVIEEMTIEEAGDFSWRTEAIAEETEMTVEEIGMIAGVIGVGVNTEEIGTTIEAIDAN
jgi:hypothetical protein